MSIPLSTIIHEEHGLTIEYFRSRKESFRRIIVFTFTEHGNTSLLGYGFGGKFPLDMGFDVIAVKSSHLSWFEEISLLIIMKINKIVQEDSTRYSMRVAYGSSMGAYATLRYSRLLQIDRVVAISPLFDINLSQDKRYLTDSKNLRSSAMMSSEFLSPICHHIILYDPYCQNSIHAAQYKEIIQQKFLDLIKLYYSGHPSTYFLSEVGILKELVVSLISEGKTIPKIRWKSRKLKSAWYLTNLGVACFNSGKLTWSLNILKKALIISPENPEIYTFIFRVFCKRLSLNASVMGVGWSR